MSNSRDMPASPRGVRLVCLMRARVVTMRAKKTQACARVATGRAIMAATASAAKRQSEKLRPPSPLLLLSEGRAVREFAASLAFAPLLLMAPRGDGHPVLALPGFLASDGSTLLMRRYFRALGYRAEGWELGRNIGGFYPLCATFRG